MLLFVGLGNPTPILKTIDIILDLKLLMQLIKNLDFQNKNLNSKDF